MNSIPATRHIFTREELLVIVDANPEALVDMFLALQDQVLKLEDQVLKLNARVAHFEALLAKDSHNSHKPPASDLKKPAPKSLRQPGQKPSGGQPGHPGHTLIAAERPDAIVRHPLDQCPAGHPLSKRPTLTYERRQVFDLPPVHLTVTEHQAEVKYCPQCRQNVTATFPAGVDTSVQYGPRFLSTLVYLRNQQLLPVERIAQLTEDLFGQSVSEATILTASQTMASSLPPFEAALRRQLEYAKVAHADETGYYVQGRRAWLHVLSTAKLTWYGVHQKRGRKALEAFGLLLRFTGRLVHDFLASYLSYTCQHAFCNAHLLRELTFVAEDLHQSWADRLRTLLLSMRERIQDLSAPPPPSEVEQWLSRYRQELDHGWLANPPQVLSVPKRGRSAQSTTRNLLRRLQSYEREVLAFLYDPSVPFTNNQAERDLRMMKVQQKISGCFRSPDGARQFASVRSYISTMRKQGHNLLDAISQAMQGRPIMPLQAGA